MIHDGAREGDEMTTPSERALEVVYRLTDPCQHGKAAYRCVTDLALAFDAFAADAVRAEREALADIVFDATGREDLVRVIRARTSASGEEGKPLSLGQLNSGKAPRP